MVAAAAIAVGAASAAAGAISSSGAGAAAGQAAGASKLGVEAQQAMYNQNSSSLAPYSEYGQNYEAILAQQMPSLMAGTQMPSEQQLQQTPGYKFTLDQGLQSAQNSAAARGLGVSGAALKAASSYATGLADNTWQQVYNAQLQGNQQRYNMLQQGVQTGLNAASSLAGVGQQSANGQQQGYTSMGQAQAAGTIGSANALAGTVSSIGGSAGSYALYNSLMNSSGTGNGFPAAVDDGGWYAG